MSGSESVASAFVEVAPKVASNFKAIVEKAMPDGGEGGRKFGGGFSQGMSGAVSAGAVAVGNMLSGLAAKGAAAAKDVMAQAFSGFADYEQLLGGVETLMGTQGAKSVQEYAQAVGKSVSDVSAEYETMGRVQQETLDNAARAFETAGLSTNEYMETVTAFSASLKAGLGKDNVGDLASYADTAVRDMADNANKMGTSMESIQNAYQGFAKQNYTMLDNLKLGYGGTKEEMKRLMSDAEKMGGLVAGSLDVENFADVVDAIHIVQENMGITGTTAEEAAKTVSGSVGMMQASWQNWMAGLGRDDVDMGALTEELVGSLEAVGSNVLPLVSRIFSSVSGALPGLVAGVAPVLVPAVSELVTSAVGLLGTLATDTLPQMLPLLVEAVAALVSSLVPEIAGMLPTLLEAGMQMFTGLAEALAQMAPRLVKMLPPLVAQVAGTLVANLPALLSAGIQLFLGIAIALVQAFPQVVSTLVAVLPLLVQELVAAGPQMLEGGKQLFNAIGQALAEIVPMLGEALWYVVTHLPEIVMDGIAGLLDAGSQLFGALLDGFMGNEPELESAAQGASESAVRAATDAADGSEAGRRMAETMAASYDFSAVQAAASDGAGSAVSAAASAADGSAIGEALASTTAKAVDVDAMSAPASDMAENAVKAAKDVNAEEVGRDFSERAAGGIDVAAMNDRAAEMARNAAGSLNAESTVSVKADLSGVNALKAASASVTSSVRSMASASAAAMKQVSSAASAAAGPFRALSATVSSSMRSCASAAASAAAKIRASVSIPDRTVRVNVARGNVKLPHFSMRGGFDPKTKAVPQVRVDWYRDGAIFEPNSPGFIGIGDAPVPEVAAPLDKLRDMLGLDGGRGGDIHVDLNYTSDADANRMAVDVARDLKRLRMAGAF